MNALPARTRAELLAGLRAEGAACVLELHGEHVRLLEVSPEGLLREAIVPRRLSLGEALERLDAAPMQPLDGAVSPPEAGALRAALAVGLARRRAALHRLAVAHGWHRALGTAEA